MIDIMMKNIAACKSTLAEAMHAVRSFKMFAFAAACDFQNIAAIAPSSRCLARAMMEGLPLKRARTVVELGAGTGAITRVLLENLPPQATLLAFEINPEFISYMQESLPDPRLVLVNARAENLGHELRRRGCDRVDAVVSSLSSRFMPDNLQRVLQDSLEPFMDEKSVYAQYQYRYGLRFENGKVRWHSSLPFLRQYFDSVQCRTIWRNLPPAQILTCRKRTHDQGQTLSVRSSGKSRAAGSLAGEQA